jgi:hypothetical protein
LIAHPDYVKWVGQIALNDNGMAWQSLESLINIKTKTHSWSRHGDINWSGSTIVAVRRPI